MGGGLARGSHPICFSFCLLPGTHAVVYEVIVAAGDGLLDSCPLVARGVLFLAAPWFVGECGRFVHEQPFKKEMPGGSPGP